MALDDVFRARRVNGAIGGPGRPATIPAMSASRAWDRAGSLPVPVAGRRLPELAGARRRAARPRRAVHVHARRGAALHDAPDADRGALVDGEGRGGARPRRHRAAPGRGQGAHVGPGRGHDRRLRDVGVATATTVRTYVASRKVGTRRPTRPMVRGVTDDGDLPGRSRVYVPLTALPMETLPDLFVHPGGYCQNVLATGDCRVVGSTTRGRPRWRSCWSATTRGRSRSPRIGPTSRSASPSTALDGVILRLEESIGGQVTRDAIVDRATSPTRRSRRRPSRSRSRRTRPSSTRRSPESERRGGRGRLRPAPGPCRRTGRGSPSRRS